MIAIYASDLVGKWSWTVWLLPPLAIVLAVLTAMALGPRGEPNVSGHRVGGSSRFLAKHEQRDIAKEST